MTTCCTGRASRAAGTEPRAGDLHAPLPLRRRLLHGLQRVLQLSGAGRGYARLTGRSGAVVLMYHSVAPDAQAEGVDPANHIPADAFARHVRYLAAHRRVVPLAEIVDAATAGRTLPAGTVALTFDDGYLDNLTVAAPLLAQHKLPATLFLPTDYIAAGRPQWIDALYVAFRTRRCEHLDLAAAGLGSWRLDERAQRHAAYGAVAERLLASDVRARAALLDAVSAALQSQAAPQRTTLTWDEVRQLVRVHPGFEIGGHTRQHVDLTALPTAHAADETAGCAADIAAALGRAPRFFSYPYNRRTPAVAAQVRAAGFSAGLADGPDPLIRAGADVWTLPRIAAPAACDLLAFYTSGAYPALPRLLTGRA